MMKVMLMKLMRKIYNRVLRGARLFYLSLGSSRECPICLWTGHSFYRKTYPNKPGDTHICPFCGSSERHRFAYFMLKDTLDNHAEKTLHFAPEKCIEPWLRSISKEYLSVDLSSANAMEHMDITDLLLKDSEFSLLWCSHVLEHIENDHKAMTELYRVLRPSGLAVIMVPVYGDTTYEDPEIKSPKERLKHFKQEDHVRLYGRDIKNRLINVGFRVEVIQTSDVLTEKVEKHALEYPSTKDIFLCTKPLTS
ncbi:type 11 methyltransferase [Candidatus Thiomargarita nelsonii]|uniref:Type 11 methyltransferase n=1 Tax=Candidatus Thiomargarita nelsonii TaxID=1003181 RepID=A0A176RWV8_9GAMM|nr:type 11 methyltransferase [Candidatus Thiomargarita nelsonii]